MELKDIEAAIIECIEENITMSGEEVPPIDRQTAPLSDLPNFDSLRTVEVMVALNDKIGCELELGDIFHRPTPQSLKIFELAITIKKKLEAPK